ncbi:hypothetical protein ACO0K9_00215 [Undibacterium sp. Ji50W]|uniref:hypothetical protein n=1 Tax=Undibacterium sp. Ji50W TaxID=3413041 RepID=UPI003BF3B772
MRPSTSPSTSITKIFLPVVLALSLISCGGGGSSGSPGTSGTSSGTSTGGTSRNLLFATDIAHGAIGKFATLNPAPGTSFSGDVISGMHWIYPTISYDAKTDQLYAISLDSSNPTSTGRVIAFGNASTMSANSTPSRNITPVGYNITTSLGKFYLDKKNDTLYVIASSIPLLCGLGCSDALLVFNHASSLNGNVKPDRVINLTITTDAINQSTVNQSIEYFTIDSSRSLLYLSLNGMIFVYPNIDTANGRIKYSRFFSVTTYDTDIALDEARDRLYSVNTSAGLTVVNGASTASGKVPLGRLRFTTVDNNSDNTQFVTFDPQNDRLYIGAYTKAYIINQASTIGTQNPPTAAVGIIAPEGISIGGFAFP